MERIFNLRLKWDASYATLKWVAVITMLIDHIGAVILEYLIHRGDLPSDTLEMFRSVDWLLRRIGRTSFPLFVFVMIDSFYYTKSRAKYLIRLLAFVLISEIPFNLAFGFFDGVSDPAFFAPGRQNVFLTLAIGFAAMWILELVYNDSMGDLPRVIVIVSVIIIGMGLGFLLKCDYGQMGVLSVITGYFAKRRGATPFFRGLSIIFILTLMSGIEAWSAVIVLPLLLCYHGEKGRPANRWFFYVFYPVHFLLLVLLRGVIF